MLLICVSQGTMRSEKEVYYRLLVEQLNLARFELIMLGTERKAVIILALIMAFRMLGLFMILPVFSAFASEIPGANATLIGIALGIYGLTQAALQLPFGALSDRIGRKPVILIGLLLFIAGSVIAALAHSILPLILGRALQGAGAIGSTTLAFVADLTRDEHRSRAMAMMGLTIGTAFSIAIVAGIIIHGWLGLSGIFWITAALGTLSILLVSLLPTPTPAVHSATDHPKFNLQNILRDKQLLRLDFGIFSLHAMLTALFIAIPIILTHHLQLNQIDQAILYILVMLFAFITMVPLIIVAEKRRKMKSIFLLAILVLIATQCLLYTSAHSTIAIAAILLSFFTAFTLLEACLPSLVSKIAPIRSKGAAMGMYSTSQFLGICVGGSLGGWIYGNFGLQAIFIFCAAIGMLWLWFASTMKQPPYLSTLIFTLEEPSLQDGLNRITLLKNLPGVAEILHNTQENLLYLKIDKKKISEDELLKHIREGTLLR